MITLGHTHTVSVIEATDSGYYLDGLNLGKILLEKRWVKRPLSPGDQIRVFIYQEPDVGLRATTQRPSIEAGEFGLLKVNQVSAYGAFMDWGMEKDLLVPFAQQHRTLEVGKSYIVHAYLNTVDQRIVGSTKAHKFVDDERPHQFKPGQAVKLIIANSTPIGYKAIINKTHWGLIKREEVFQRISYGQSMPGFIQGLRPDGKINLTLNGGFQVLDKNGEKIMNYLKANNGASALNDKTDPKIIYAKFGISKAAFKKAIGNLYKQNKIEIGKGHIKLK